MIALAVLDAAISWCPQPGCDGTGFVHRADGEASSCPKCAGLRETRAAVAELLEAERDLAEKQQILRELAHDHSPFSVTYERARDACRTARKRRDIALVKFGGAA